MCVVVERKTESVIVTVHGAVMCRKGMMIKEIRERKQKAYGEKKAETDGEGIQK